MSPPIRTPSIKSFIRLTHRSNVVLPQPEGPIKAVTRPLATGIVISCRACFRPYHKLKFSTSRTGASRRTLSWINAWIEAPAAIAARRFASAGGTASTFGASVARTTESKAPPGNVTVGEAKTMRHLMN